MSYDDDKGHWAPTGVPQSGGEVSTAVDEAMARYKAAQLPWRVCRTCKAICNGKHESMLATGDLAEQKCPWFNKSGFRCTLAAPHPSHHYNIEAPVGEQKWLEGIDSQGRLERWKATWRRTRKSWKSRFAV